MLRNIYEVDRVREGIILMVIAQNFQTQDPQIRVQLSAL